MERGSVKVIGLDLSLKATGICVLDGVDEVEKIWTKLLSRDSTKSEEESLLRLESIAKDVIDIVQEVKPDLVVVEAPAKNQVWQAAAIGEVHGVVKVQIHLATGIIPMVVQATRARKDVVGHIERKTNKTVGLDGKVVSRVNYGSVKGKRGVKKATVKDVIEMRLRDRGLTFPSQDEMDAYVVAKFGWNRCK